MLNLDFNYVYCWDKDLRDKMFITELKKYQGYYMGSVEHEHRKEVKEAFDFQLEAVVQYLKLIREGEPKWNMENTWQLLKQLAL